MNIPSCVFHKMNRYGIKELSFSIMDGEDGVMHKFIQVKTNDGDLNTILFDNEHYSSLLEDIGIIKEHRVVRGPVPYNNYL